MAWGIPWSCTVMEWVGIILVLLFGVGFSFLHYKIYKNWPKNNSPSIPQQPQVTHQVIDLSPLIRIVDDLPTKVLQSITSSSNTHKGALGELIGYINLRASYDR